MTQRRSASELGAVAGFVATLASLLKGSPIVGGTVCRGDDLPRGIFQLVPELVGPTRAAAAAAILTALGRRRALRR